MVVSFINLPVYMEDVTILARLEEWGVRPISVIKRRKWSETEIADGTRFLKVCFKGTLTFVAFENYSKFKSSRLPPMPHPLSVIF